MKYLLLVILYFVIGTFLSAWVRVFADRVDRSCSDWLVIFYLLFWPVAIVIGCWLAIWEKLVNWMKKEDRHDGET